MTELDKLLGPVVQALGFELWGIERLGGHERALVRIYIDAEQGVTIADCEAVSRQISALLDVEDPIRGSFTLEVSSPGTDRPIFNGQQFQRFIGEQVNLKLKQKIHGRTRVKGELEEVNDEAIIVSIDGFVYAIPLAVIDKANLIWQQ